MQCYVLHCVDQNHFEYACKCNADMYVKCLKICGPSVSTLCAHYNPLAPFVATTHNTNSQKGGGGGGAGSGGVVVWGWVNRLH